MATLGLVLMLVGAVVGCIGGVMVLIQAFKTSVLWGLGTIFVPFVGLIFVITHWQETKKAFLINIIGFAVMILGAMMGFAGTRGPSASMQRHPPTSSPERITPPSVPQASTAKAGSADAAYLVRELELQLASYRLEQSRFPWAKPAEVSESTVIDAAQVCAELRGDKTKATINKTQDYLKGIPLKFIKDGRIVDPWGNEIRFRVNSTLDPVIWSCGPDGKDDTNDGVSPDLKKKPQGYYWFGKGDTGDDITNL